MATIAEQVDRLTARLKADGYEVVSGPRTTGDGYYESCIVGLHGAARGSPYRRGYSDRRRGKSAHKYPDKSVHIDRLANSLREQMTESRQRHSRAAARKVDNRLIPAQPASMMCAHFLKRVKSGELKRVLYVATGALMSPTIVQQGGSIPGIAHAVEIS